MRTALLVLVCLSLIFATASAQGIVVPGDADGDMIVSDEELRLAEQSYSEGKITSDELEEIKHIHEKYPLTVTNSYGDTVTIYKPVNRIISTSSWSVEMLLILDAFDKVVGVTSTQQEDFSWIPGMDSKPSVGAWDSIDYEKIIELNPDIVNTKLDQKDAMEHAGITFLRLSTRNWTTFETDLKCLGKVLEKEERAEEFISWNENYKSQLAEIVDSIPPEKRLRVYAESTNHDYFAAASNSGVHYAITSAGGINIGKDLSFESAFIDVDPEWILTENPHTVIIAATMTRWPPNHALDYYPSDTTESLNQYLELTRNRPGIMNTDAAKNGRIYLLHGHCSEGASRGVIAAYYVAKWLYPEYLQDIDPNEIHEEYFEKWLGVPYQGIWAYPQAS